jgi:eukaryotic-like serine/threonine-protein kinase
MSTQPDRVDKYELQQSLGKNGISEAWKAFDNQAHRYVAVKLFHAQLKADPDFVTRFQQEARAIVSLRHPSIVPCYNFSITQFPETESATAYLVMEYLEGGTLADYNRNASQTGKLLSIPEIVHLFSSIGMAIDFAHRQHVIHGNLKPTNILLDKQNTANSSIGEPMVSDFNTAKLMGPTGSNAGALWNSSPFYVSPEQVMGAPANELSDIYSLGIMLYEICTGTVPFLGNSAESIMMQQVNTVPASPSLINPKLPPALSTVVMRCIAKDPKARFPSVLALVAALTNVEGQSPVNVSHPENVGQYSGSFATQERDMPTVISAKMSPLPAGLVASGPMYASNAQMGGISQPYSSAQWADKSTVDAIHQPLPVQTPVGGSTPPPTAPTSKRPRRRGLLIAMIVILILAVIGSALGAYFTFFAKGTTATTTTTTPQLFGHAYFVSSGFVSPDSRQGITDELQINLVNVSPAPSGKSYYAWLLNDITMDWKPIYLGQLAYNSGTLNLFYPGDAMHSNLLATNSRFLVTEEDASTIPTSPSLDPHAWVYYAEFSQIKPVPTDPTSYSLYDHIRHLLADDPKVKAAGLTGGLDIWLYRNTQKILEWAGSARDAWKDKSVAFIHRQLIRMIDYLDGTLYAQKDIPGQSILADPTLSKIGLLTFDPLTQNPPGYLYHIGKHLHEITALPQTSAAQRALAIQINQEIDVVNLWMRSIKADVLQLYAMNDAQLTGQEGRTLLDEVATLANDAFVGKFNSNAQVTAGVVQIHYAIQRLATFDVRACTTSDPCTVS